MNNPELILIFLASCLVVLAISVMVFETFTKHRQVIREIRREAQRVYVRDQLGLDLDDAALMKAMERRDQLRGMRGGSSSGGVGIIKVIPA